MQGGRGFIAQKTCDGAAESGGLLEFDFGGVAEGVEDAREGKKKLEENPDRWN